MSSGEAADKRTRPVEESDMVARLGSEVGLSEAEARLYIALLRDGSMPAESKGEVASKLIRRGMAIVSGDGKKVIPVHPRLGVANYYRTWRESVVREINERRMRVDKLIIELIPVYEAAREKRTEGRGD